MRLDFFYYSIMGMQIFGAPLGGNTGNNQTSVSEIRLAPMTLSFNLSF